MDALGAWLGAPSWVWGACFMVGFVLLSALTMALTRLPVRSVPPPWSPAAPAGVGRNSEGREDAMAEWKVVRTAPDQLTGEMWVDALQEADIVAKIGPGDTASFMGTSVMSVRVLVAEERLQEAAALLDEAFGAEDEALEVEED
jgi:hypothetical protein